MADDVQWMTYAELAEALGIGGDSARNLVRRKRWARQLGNDGMARVGVPIEHLQEGRGSEPPADPPADGGSDGDDDGASVVSVLTNHICRLERDLHALKEEHAAERSRLRDEAEVLRQERDAERLRATQVEVLQAVLDEIRQDRDRWHATATARRSWWPWRRTG
ncbi:hypothetical protein [Methylobacterium nodulans]|uniref:Uncharacterized protein n=1 Tax=Methylobacterium nodulans (strain LMG 21967 / CNCM I-2342 / ORS 2060) TaxID=460265 RepID=B8IY71_METNO|nr:hypothetical protein [Methylobacterium nodulans]ACL63361.1 conserved hypothetical protein [Methylobacterium nodulans ORS 2060]